MKLLFRGSTQLESQIDVFLDQIQQSALIFKAGLKYYLDGQIDDLKERIIKVGKLESAADKLRREIRFTLYTQMLIPESRGDVLGLLETSDDLVDIAKKGLMQFEIERPQIPESLKQDFLTLAETSAEAVEAVVKAITAYFKEMEMINNYINKVNFYENEADKQELGLKHKVFNSPEITSLSHRLHLKSFIEEIVYISDAAQRVAERLSISAIKRSV